jgi:predicted TIM-barrel fold metal-dependent hydrolase
VRFIGQQYSRAGRAGQRTGRRPRRGTPARTAALILVLLLGRLIGPAAAQGAWIDTHMHLVGGASDAFADAAREAVRAMDAAGIAQAIVLPTPQVDGVPRPYDFDAYASALRAHGRRFVFLGGSRLNRLIHATPPERVDAALRRRFEAMADEVLAAGASGFGEMGVHHLSLTPGHLYSQAAADHPLFLLLAEIAARRDVPIDIHFDVVAQDMKLPAGLATPANPPEFAANLVAFERLLAHERRARIVWAHAGSDMLGHGTPGLARDLLRRHPNLYMSLRLMPGRAPQNHPLTRELALKPEWRRLLGDFPDRFTIGTDRFVPAPGLSGTAPGQVFARLSATNLERTRAFLAALPEDLRRRIAIENARRIYKLAP